MRKYNEERLIGLLKEKSALIVSHDAGASEILSSLIRRIKPEKAKYVLEGPGRYIFSAKFPGIEIDELSEGLFAGSDIVITGTSMFADLERDAIAIAKRMHKYSVSILDHWVNYRERFVPAGRKTPFGEMEIYLPDEIWVPDTDAYDAALRAELPENRLVLIDNYYLMDLKKRVLKYKRDHDEKSILYICEPVYDYVKLLKGDGDAWGYNEYDLIKDAIESLPVVENYFNRIIFRLHPAEARGKYSDLLSGYSGKVKLEVTSPKETRLENDCMRSDCVIGAESMALAAALFLGKKVFSCLPEKAVKPCALPHKDIIHINSLRDVLNFIGGAK